MTFSIVVLLVRGNLRSTGDLLGKGAELGGSQLQLEDGAESMWLQE